MPEPEPNERRIGVFGGTFDPVHVGHIDAARAALEAVALDEVLLVVANDPWKKSGLFVAAAADRLAMVEAAVAGLPGLTASDIEIERGGVSYSADTLVEVSRLYPGAELFLIVGADLLEELSTWERVDEIKALSRLVVLTRPGSVVTGQLARAWGAEIAQIPAVDVSSTEIRDRLAKGLPVDGLVPAGAIQVISERGLYALGR